MHLLPELPQPFKNIYNDYQLLDHKDINKDINKDFRLAVIHRISRNCFRLLLTIPLVLLMRVAYSYTKSPASIITLGIFAISPSASLLVGAGFFSLLSISKVVNAIANRCLADLGGAVFAGICAGFISENYQHFEDHLIAILENKLMIIPDKIGEKISPNKKVLYDWWGRELG